MLSSGEVCVVEHFATRPVLVTQDRYPYPSRTLNHCPIRHGPADYTRTRFVPANDLKPLLVQIDTVSQKKLCKIVSVRTSSNFHQY